MKLFFDTETTDVIKWGLPFNNPSQPLPVSLAMVVTDNELNVVNEVYTLIKVDRDSEEGAIFHHQITRKMTDESGIEMGRAFEEFRLNYVSCDEIIGHNVKFDIAIMNCLAAKLGAGQLPKQPTFCTMLESTVLCRIPKVKGGGLKWPKQSEAYKILCGKELVGAHNALVDVKACVEIYKAIKKLTTRITANEIAMGPQSSGDKPVLSMTSHLNLLSK